MMSRLLIFFLFISINCFSSNATFLNKNVHIPSSDEAPYVVSFCTTRSLDNGSLKISLLSQLKIIFNIGSFVETGTYLGDTTLEAAQIFDQVDTIELSKELYLKAFRRLGIWKNVGVHFGNSEEILKSLLPNIHKRILFYLDGHYSGHVTARGSLDTPVIKELQAIEEAKKADSIILVDDIRLFQDSCFPEKSKILNLGLETYPDLKEVIIAILRINPSYQICFLGDALLAFPRDQQICVSPVMRACALHRLGYLLELSEEELKNADQVIGNAESDEKKELGIYYQTYAPFELDYGYRSYASLWYALILREAGHEEQALLLLKKTAENSLPNWRVSQCIN
jgi:hypothetical protein